MMTNEEALQELIRAFDVLANSCHMDNHRKEAFNRAYAALKAEPCEDAISKQSVLNKIEEVCFSNEQKWVDFRVSQGSNGQRDFITNFIASSPLLTPKQKRLKWTKQKTLEWIPVKDPYTELPKKDKLWITREERGYRWVDTIYYDMTEWSDYIWDVVAYAPYEEPEPYKEEDNE